MIKKAFAQGLFPPLPAFTRLFGVKGSNVFVGRCPTLRQRVSVFLALGAQWSLLALGAQAVFRDARRAVEFIGARRAGCVSRR